MSAGVPDLAGGQPDRKRRWPFFLIVLAMAAVFGYILWKSAHPSAPETVPGAEAQAELRNAAVAAKTYYTDGDSFRGFGLKTAAKIEPAITWNKDEVAVPGEVSIRDVAGEHILFVSASPGGGAWCLAVDAGTGDTYGTTDAKSVGECSGKAW